jgi:hypothetical protein
VNWLDLATVFGEGADAVTRVSEHGIIPNTVIFQFCDECVTYFSSGLVMYSLISEGSGVHNGGPQGDCHTIKVGCSYCGGLYAYFGEKDSTVGIVTCYERGRLGTEC